MSVITINNGHTEAKPCDRRHRSQHPLTRDQQSSAIRLSAASSTSTTQPRSRRNAVHRILEPHRFDAAAAAIGEPGLTPHELRHTAASLAVSAGANVKAVQRMLGHASAALTLDRYADLFEDDLDAVADRLDVARSAVVHQMCTTADIVDLASARHTATGQ